MRTILKLVLLLAAFMFVSLMGLVLWSYIFS